jgi:hypothetical protein
MPYRRAPPEGVSLHPLLERSLNSFAISSTEGRLVWTSATMAARSGFSAEAMRGCVLVRFAA